MRDFLIAIAATGKGHVGQQRVTEKDPLVTIRLHDVTSSEREDFAPQVKFDLAVELLEQAAKWIRANKFKIADFRSDKQEWIDFIDV